MSRLLTVILIVLLVFSIALNAATLWFIFRAREVTLDTVYRAKQIVDDAGNDTLRYNYPISQTMPVHVVVPIREDVTVPISTVVPIKTVVTVNVDTGVFGPLPLTIPIDGAFPVNVTLPVHVEKDVAIDTVIPIHVTVPIVVPIADTPLADYLRRLSAGLDDTGRLLNGQAPGQNP